MTARRVENAIFSKRVSILPTLQEILVHRASRFEDLQPVMLSAQARLARAMKWRCLNLHSPDNDDLAQATFYSHLEGCGSPRSKRVGAIMEA